MDFVSRDFSQYAWSLRTLDRRLHHFQICHTDRNVTVDEVEAAVKKELEGPGKLLGYRAFHKKIRQVYDLNMPRNLVYAVMYNVDADTLEGLHSLKTRSRKVTSRHQGLTTYIHWMAMTN